MSITAAARIPAAVIIREAHSNLLWARVSLTERPEFADPARGVLLKAGAGAFFVHVRKMRDVSLGGALGVGYRAPSWLAANRMRDGRNAPLADYRVRRAGSIVVGEKRTMKSTEA